MSNEWIENVTGECPVDKDTLVDVKINGHEDHPSYNTVGNVANDWCWEIDCCDSITHWRLHKPKKQPEKFLEDAYDNPESANEIFGATERRVQETYKYPETTYQPLPSTNSRPLECRISDAMCALHEGLHIDSKIVAQIIRLAKEMEE